MDKIKTVLWWGRFNPGYSRNRILRDLLHDNGWEVVDFHPSWSSVGDLQALLKRMPRPDLIWVPNFRQRDFYAAKRYARRLNVPILFDPLISSYDKRVFENRKLAEGSFRAERLRRWEGGMFRSSRIVLADTQEHARFFSEELGADPARIFIVPVGAEEKLFVPQPGRAPAGPVEVLFYGSFVPLQGVRFIVEAARLVPEVNWTFVGQGKLRENCERASVDLANVSFEDWVPCSQLAERIGKADILLGIFGDTPKASRVIPNKLYQAIACARPIITMDSPVYSQDVREAGRSGVAWIPAASPEALANAVRQWAKHPEMLEERGQSARALYNRFYANDKVADALMKALSVID
ncbi:glycosyltransferase [Tichowtungia aerotolerans]|uniref:Glycosyltransferase n=1 Tax=Tichowtungia aerotolerans TaxID=2697043 RepID=A0A6P1M2K5_9BACT|nr:glycosyltransferase [Tichowtungia aerotolerans]QHI68081.1 glycosyltransferase [Tichowtungia aerotolerans]